MASLVTAHDHQGRPASNARRQLAAELHRLRLRSGLPGEKIAAQLGWSPSKISRWENARVSPPAKELARLLDVLGVTGPERTALVQLGKTALEPGWWQQYEEYLPPGMAQLIAVEQEAKVIFIWQPDVVPALLQTEPYARALLTTRRRIEPVPPVEINHSVTAQMRRQTPDGPPPSIQVVLGEAALRHNVGGPDVMRGQMNTLFNASPRVDIRILPSATHRPIATGPFSLVSFIETDDEADGQVPDVVAVEMLTGVILLDSIRDTYLHRLAWRQLAKAACDAAASRDLIGLVIEQQATGTGGRS